MTKLLKRILVFALTITMVAGVALSVPAAKADAAEGIRGKLVVIHTNDIHGYYEKTDSSLGLSSVKALKGHYERLGANVLLLDAGDFSQGTNLVNYFKGKSAVDFLNAAGYDAVSLGNHEFDFGMDSVKALQENANFAILDANILDKETGAPYFAANKIFKFDNMKVGVFGLDTPEAQTKVNPKNVAGMTFLAEEELYACAMAQVNELKAAGCDYIICIGHLGLDDESIGNRSIDVINNVGGIDLFVDGHSHTEIAEPMKVGKTMVVSTGNYLNNIGLVTFEDEGIKTSLVKDLYHVGGCAPIDDFVATYDKIVDDAYAGTFATTTYKLDGKKEPGVRTQETNLGDFAADSYLYTAQEYVGDTMKVDGAIQNGGGIRATVDPGEISMNTLYTVFPFGNSISIVEITGAQLLEALEASCFSAPKAVGGFPQVAGIKFTIDTTVPYAAGANYPASTYAAPAAPGTRVTIEEVGGEKFDMDAVYHIACNNFMADGGDTYYVFSQSKNIISTGVVDAEGMIAYVKTLDNVIGEQYKEPQGRITIIK